MQTEHSAPNFDQVVGQSRVAWRSLTDGDVVAANESIPAFFAVIRGRFGETDASIRATLEEQASDDPEVAAARAWEAVKRQARRMWADLTDADVAAANGDLATLREVISHRFADSDTKLQVRLGNLGKERPNKRGARAARVAAAPETLDHWEQIIEVARESWPKLSDGDFLAAEREPMKLFAIIRSRFGGIEEEIRGAFAAVTGGNEHDGTPVAERGAPRALAHPPSEAPAPHPEAPATAHEGKHPSNGHVDVTEVGPGTTDHPMPAGGRMRL
jgi:hypothetical protein